MDVGILILRVLVGLTLAAHGSQKLFGAFGGRGIGGTTEHVRSLGFRPARMYAYALGGGELLGGSLFAAGLFTPVASLTTIAIMTTAAVTVHWKKGFFAVNGGFELPFVIATTAAAVAFTGPGAYSLDGVLGSSLDGAAAAVGAVALGVVVGLGVVAMRKLPERMPVHRARTQM
jgi:putative oxidoreductase